MAVVNGKQSTGSRTPTGLGTRLVEYTTKAGQTNTYLEVSFAGCTLRSILWPVEAAGYAGEFAADVAAIVKASGKGKGKVAGKEIDI